MLSSGNDFTTTGGSCFTINNDISLCGEGTVTLLDENMGKMLTLGGMITGSGGLEIAASTCGSANTLTFAYGGSTFTGGVSVDSGNTNLVVGASSSTSDGSIIQGPLGKGTLMLSDGNNFTTLDSSCYTIDNDITLCGGGNVTLLGGSMGTMLTLNGMITGGSSLKIIAPGCGGSTLVTLNNAGSTFCGGLMVDDGSTTLVVGNSGEGSAGDIGSSPLGTGTLTLGNNTILTTPSGTCVTVLNQIYLGTGACNSTVYVGGLFSTLTLAGNITDYDSEMPAALYVNGPTVLEGCNSYSGGTTVSNTTLTVATNSGLGSGDLRADSNATVNFTSGSPTISAVYLNSGTLNFNTAGSPSLGSLSMLDSTIHFAAGSMPTITEIAADTIDSDNVIDLGSGPSSTTLTFELNDDPKFFGEIKGTGSLQLITIEPGVTTGELDLENPANSYTGGTTVNSGVLLVADSNGVLGSGPITLNSGAAFGVNSGVVISNPITVNNGAFVGGYGTLAPASPITFGAGSGFVGGRGTIGGGGDSSNPIIGAFTFGTAGTNASVVIAGNSGMEFSIKNDTGTAGTDFSAVTVVGSVTFNNTVSLSEPFTIELIGVDSGGFTTGTANSFDTASMHSWTLLSATSLSFTGGFNVSDFQIDTSAFSNSTASHFYVTQSGNSLDLNFTPVPEPSTWVLMAGGLCMLFGVAVRRRRA
jgi:autotransporter-associated beta strand protein